MRKVITLIAQLCAEVGLSDWRQSTHNIKNLKKLYRKAQGLKRSKAKKAQRVEQKQRRIVEAHKNYTDAAEWYLEKATGTLAILSGRTMVSQISCYMVEHYMRHAERQIDQVKIPHEEKVFSIFEEHMEWISKGKAGVPQELGLKVCVVEDQNGFLLNHIVMRKTSDKDITLPMIEDTKRVFPALSSCSFDKNFYSPENREQLERILALAVMPKKGRSTETERDREYSDEFLGGRQRHSLVESGISALENHGLDRCLDHGIRGFERYVALAVAARNIQILGTVLWKMKVKQLKRAALVKRKAA